MGKRGGRKLQTSCSFAEELFSLIEFYSEIEDSGRQVFQKCGGCSATDAAIVHPKFQASIRQAKTFFTPAETPHHRARPSFCYYAFLNLAKALLCVHRPSLMETLKASECFDADSGRDIAVEVREYFIPDFSEWKKPNRFESAFEKLRRDLQKEGISKPKI